MRCGRCCVFKLPFGEELFAGTAGRTTAQGYTNSDGARQKFTQKERDIETGLDYFINRYYSSTQGRFTTTDPIIMDPDRAIDPQAINLYGYVRNNPLRYIDPTGEIINEPTGLDEKYQKRYEDWKKKLLSTKEGRAMWDKYANDTNFTLNITMTDRGSDDENKGAETGQYQFDKSGNLTGATITLGNNMGGGIASGTYPVQSTLTDADAHTLAAAKLAHEFGHVEDVRARAARTSQEQPLLDAFNARLKSLEAANVPSQTIIQDTTLTGLKSQFQTKFGYTMDDSTGYRELRAESLAVPVIRQLTGSSLSSGVKELQRRLSTTKYKP